MRDISDTKIPMKILMLIARHLPHHRTNHLAQSNKSDLHFLVLLIVYETRIVGLTSHAGLSWERCVVAANVLNRVLTRKTRFQGGFARVYEAEDLEGFPHAIKVVAKVNLKSQKSKTKVSK